jgi:hypothetical protein
LTSLPPPPRRPLEAERKGELTTERLGTAVAALVLASYMCDHSGLETGDIIVVTATIEGVDGIDEVGLEGDQSRSSGDVEERHLSYILVAYQT